MWLSAYAALKDKSGTLYAGAGTGTQDLRLPSSLLSRRQGVIVHNHKEACVAARREALDADVLAVNPPPLRRRDVKDEGIWSCCWPATRIFDRVAHQLCRKTAPVLSLATMTAQVTDLARDTRMGRGAGLRALPDLPLGYLPAQEKPLATCADAVQ